MELYWIKTSSLIKRLFNNQVWAIPNAENKIYLTFDDGPTPEVTEWVLDILKAYNIKATFFCIGNNIEKYPEIFKKTIQSFEGYRLVRFLGQRSGDVFRASQFEQTCRDSPLRNFQKSQNRKVVTNCKLSDG